MKTLARFFFILLVTVGLLEAHPVAQGSLEFDLRGDHVAVRARVSNEQVFVASAFARPGAEASDWETMFRSHGYYLLQHLQLLREGAPLRGQIQNFVLPDDRTTNGFAIYELRYPFEGAAPPALTVKQDLLQEIEFAAGTRWTASFAVTQRRDGAMEREVQLLTPTEPLTLSFSSTPASPLNRGALFMSYLRHGIAHILHGWDHLLFIAALVLAVTSFWDFVKVVTAFTIAHTLTLTISTFGYARLPSSVVEPMIALSIVVVAVQNIFFPKSARGRSRLLVAFGFGLFHGLGFAGGLIAAMQEMSAAVTTIALAGFSVGVEIGHQVVALPVLLLLLLARKSSGNERPPILGTSSPVLRFGSVMIALAGCAYFGLALRG